MPQVKAMTASEEKRVLRMIGTPLIEYDRAKTVSAFGCYTVNE